MNRSDHPRPPRALLLVAVAAAALNGGCADDSAPSTPTTTTSNRQADVAERGASVMPFDLERTTHRFTRTDTGGVQTVVADDPRDSTQITLVQQHVSAEVERFRRGDFSDPARIHGTEMPGLATLRAHGGRITITYEAIPDGARATYATDDAGLRDALHHWFDAQVSDHGSHATR
ncbi:aspartate carbamoyltransferase [Micromonospora arida]|uniref:aspartate carbamoyltransferase n=1 Tax=Micromonospora arida TaxID=2203715 RepID=UPI000F5F5D40|nr:aspartate carbamoyltransferase [Micromonospora arida]